MGGRESVSRQALFLVLTRFSSRNLSIATIALSLGVRSATGFGLSFAAGLDSGGFLGSFCCASAGATVARSGRTTSGIAFMGRGDHRGSVQRRRWASFGDQEATLVLQARPTAAGFVWTARRPADGNP